MGGIGTWGSALVVVISLCFIILLLAALLVYRHLPFFHINKRTVPVALPADFQRITKEPQKTVKHICPVCGTELGRGEQVRSVVYGGGRYQDGRPKEKLAHIKGCTHCLEGLKTRRCPVCHAILSNGDFLIAELRDGGSRASGKPHITIIGCSKCKGTKSS